MSKKILACLIAMALLATVLAGCASSEPKESVPPVEPSASESPETEEVSEAPQQEKAPAPHPVGDVIAAEDCKAAGYDVQYGMYDFETYAQLPLTDSGETLSYWMMMQPFTLNYNIEIEKTTFFTEMEKRTGVKLAIQSCSVMVASEQFNLVIASGDIPDMMEGVSANYSGGLEKAVNDGVFVDFTGFMDELMPNYTAWLNTFPELRASVTNLDGSIAQAGAIGGGMPHNVGPQLRQDWLDSLGLDTPETYDEYHDVLEAFKTEYGGSLWLDPSGALRNNCFSSGYDVVFEGATSAITAIDGVAHYAPYTDGYRDYLSLLNSWWKEGLIYPDFLSQASVSTPDNGLVMNNEIGVWVSDADTMTTYDNLSEEIVVGAAPLPRKTADQQLHLYMADTLIGDGTVISTDCESLVLAAGWLDYTYTYDGMLLNCYGLEGEGMAFDENGQPHYTDLVLNNPEMMTIACVVAYSKYGGAGVFNIERLMEGYDEKQKAAVALWNDGVDSAYEYPVGVHKTTEQSERYALLLSELQTYVNQATLSFIVGDTSVEEGWDAYKAALEQMNVGELEELLQEIYDVYMESMK